MKLILRKNRLGIDIEIDNEGRFLCLFEAVSWSLAYKVARLSLVQGFAYFRKCL